MGIPGINTVLVPYEKKDAYNRSTTSLDPPSSAETSDLGGLFAGDIIASLQALQTGDEAIGVLANLAVLNGDYLRLDTSIRNTGGQGGDNDGAGFPNGRRLGDDVIDTVVTIINNFEPVRRNGKVDRVNGNDKRFRSKFPYLADPHQPLGWNGVDGTENWALAAYLIGGRQKYAGRSKRFGRFFFEVSRGLRGYPLSPEPGRAHQEWACR